MSARVTDTPFSMRRKMHEMKHKGIVSAVIADPWSAFLPLNPRLARPKGNSRVTGNLPDLSGLKTCWRRKFEGRPELTCSSPGFSQPLLRQSICFNKIPAPLGSLQQAPAGHRTDSWVCRLTREPHYTNWKTVSERERSLACGHPARRWWSWNSGPNPPDFKAMSTHSVATPPLALWGV